jgi:hypothetical protein
MDTMKSQRTAGLALAGALLLALVGCTQEQQNKINREIQNWTGTNGVLEVYAGDKVVRRFLKIDKISTALGTDDGNRAPTATVMACSTRTSTCWSMPARKRSTSRSATTPTRCSSKTRAEAGPGLPRGRCPRGSQASSLNSPTTAMS